MNPNEIITNGQEFAYWDNTRTQPGGTTENEHNALNNLFTAQKQNQSLPNYQQPQHNFTQPPIQQLPVQQPSLSLPGSTLSLVIETESARLKITFEPK